MQSHLDASWARSRVPMAKYKEYIDELEQTIPVGCSPTWATGLGGGNLVNFGTTSHCK